MTSPFTNKLMKELLENVRVAIKNSLKNADVLEKVLEFGLSGESFTTAEELLKKAETLYITKGPRTGQKLSLSIQVKDRINNIHKSFMIYVKLIRTSLKKDPAFFSEFNLSGKRDTTVTGKINEPKTFYQNCLDNEKVGNYAAAKHGLTREKIETLMAEIAELEKELEKRATLIKDAEQATQERNKVFRELSDWWINYRRILTHVFRDDPQRLEEFNITAYSEGYKPNKKKKPDAGESGGEGESNGKESKN
jgi:hypothetical protein